MITKSKFVLISLMLISFALVVMFLFLKQDLAIQMVPKYLNLKKTDSQLPHLANEKINPFLNIIDEKLVSNLVIQNLIPNKNNASKSATNLKTIYDVILEKPNEIVLKYINLPYDYKYGSNSIPLVVSSLICNGDLLELGMVLIKLIIKI